MNPKSTNKDSLEIEIEKLKKELESLKEAKENLKTENEIKDEFISMISHELRTPLTSIRGYLSMILDWDLWEINLDIRKWLNHSYDSTVRLIWLVNDVLSLSKIESWKMEYYMSDAEVKRIIKSAYKDMYLEMEHKNIKFNVEMKEELDWVLVHVDDNKLKQVLLNLLTNAYKFTENGWEITIKTSIDWDKIRIEIIDTWVGISEENLSILFDKFTQTESTLQRHNTSWLWLWLALCKEFIQEFWSEIKIDSKLWEGSNFYFDLKIV